MRLVFDKKKASGLTALCLLLCFGAVSAQKKPVLRKKTVVKKPVIAVVPAVPRFKVDAGTVLRTRMNSTISSKTAKVGDTFKVTVTEPAYSSNGVVVIPTGSTLTGRVNAVKPAANGGKPGEIDASFISLRLPNGRTSTINGSLTELRDNKTSTDNEGTATGDTMKNRKIIFIGGGGAGGAVLGAAIGGGKGALIGGLIGAGAGFIGDRYTKGKDAEVAAGTEFGVNLNQPIELPRFVEDNPVNP